MLKRKIFDIFKKIVRNFFPELRMDKKSLQYLLYKRAIESSAAFIEQHMLFAEPFQTREGLYRFLFERLPEKGLLLEFGVHNGHSINMFAALTSRQIHGFDSFEGLPNDALIPSRNDGGSKWFAGKMTNRGHMPTVRENVRLYKGWFDEVLPEFVNDHAGETAALLHIDCDIYSSTASVFQNFEKTLVPGTIILFDEYLNFEGWQKHEHKAFMELVERLSLEYEFIAYAYYGAAACVIRNIGVQPISPKD